MSQSKFGIKSKRAYKSKTIIDNKEFIKVWMTSSSVADVALAFETTSSTISSKAYQLRSKGVHLPAMAKKFDEVDELNKLIKKMSK